nr:hypothetical protein [Marinicella sp. W31]MDC2879877.1 hypothetical protein [Marinicella sp. W31]
MTQADGNTFAGTEATLQTTLFIYDLNNYGDTVNYPAIPVHEDMSWTSDDVCIFDQTDDGSTRIALADVVYAIATDKSTGDLGPTSPPSLNYTVGTPPKKLDRCRRTCSILRAGASFRVILYRSLWL